MLNSYSDLNIFDTITLNNMYFLSSKSNKYVIQLFWYVHKCSSKYNAVTTLLCTIMVFLCTYGKFQSSIYHIYYIIHWITKSFLSISQICYHKMIRKIKLSFPSLWDVDVFTFKQHITWAESCVLNASYNCVNSAVNGRLPCMED